MCLCNSYTKIPNGQKFTINPQIIYLRLSLRDILQPHYIFCKICTFSSIDFDELFRRCRIDLVFCSVNFRILRQIIFSSEEKYKQIMNFHQSLHKLVSCLCKVRCSGNCKCCKYGLLCSAACKCYVSADGCSRLLS